MTANVGRAWVFGDNIDTDQLAPGTYLKGAFENLVPHCLEAVRAEFAGSVQPGDVVVMDAAGGGGYGNPLDRDPDSVANDVADGYVSAEGARQDYGVAIDPETLEVLDVQPATGNLDPMHDARARVREIECLEELRDRA